MRRARRGQRLSATLRVHGQTVLPLLTALLSALAACAAPPPRPDVLARVATITPGSVREQVEAVAAIGPRSLADDDNVRTTLELIESRLRAYGYEPVEERFDSSLRRQIATQLEGGGWLIQSDLSPQRPYVNVVAESRRALAPGEVVEIGAHYDTVRGTVGADDNTSGVAALLEAARVAADVETERTIRFVFYALEEPGLHGSRAHVAKLTAGDGAAARAIDAALIIDSIGYADHEPDSQGTPFIRIPLLFWMPTTADFLAVGGNWYSGPVADDFVEDAARYEPELPIYAAKRLAGLTELPDRSDVGNYWKAGIPAVFLGDTSNYRSPHYHRSSDTPDTLDYAFLAQVTRASAAWLLERAGLPPAPSP